jgi:hypothetical protein
MVNGHSNINDNFGIGYPRKGVFYLTSNNNYVTQEFGFWLQIMGDHARFIKNSLNPDQANLSMVAGNFIELFDRLLEKARQTSSYKDSLLQAYATEILQATLSLRDFKRELLADRLNNKAVTFLSPIFYNHMLNELEEFLSVLADIEAGRQKVENVLGQHLLWSSDAAAHAGTLGSDLDKVEYQLIETSRIFEASFDHFYIRAVELTGYFRSNPPSVDPVLEAYNVAMTKQMKEFMAFLKELKQGLTSQQILGRLVPLVPDHMYREECYYLSKIVGSESSLSMPDCDPGKPRVES